MRPFLRVSPPTDRRPPGPRGERAGARAAWLVGAGIFLSRVSGFVRESVFAYFLGTSPHADVWRAALRTPNVIQNLLGEGTLSASFIPVYAEFLEQGREEDAGRFAGAALGLLTVVSFGLALVGILLAPILIRLFFPVWEPWQHELGIDVVRVLFIMVAFLVVSAWALGVLNSHGKFFLSYVAPVVWNIAIVGTLVVFAGWRQVGPDQLLISLAFGALVGGVLQLLIQLPWVVPLLKGFRLSFSRQVAGMKEAITNFWPVLVARGVINLSGLIDMILAGLLAAGAIAVVGYAQTLYMLPISLFGMSIAASELPDLSRSRGEALQVVAPRVRVALQRVAYLVVPSCLAYLVLGDVFVAALFERGSFSATGTVVCYAVLAAYSLGLVASSSSRALSSAYYALRDTRTPARIAAIRVGVSIVIGASLMFLFDRFSVGAGEDVLGFGAVGLGLGAAAGAWLEYVLLRRGLAGALGPHGPGMRFALVVLAGAVVAAGAGAGTKWLLGSSVPYREGLLHTWLGADSWLVAPLLALGTALAFGVVYLVCTRTLGVRVSRGGLSPR